LKIKLHSSESYRLQALRSCLRCADGWLMTSVTADICSVIGMLALLVFVFLVTLRINNNRKAREHSRRLTSRLLNWK